MIVSSVHAIGLPERGDRRRRLAAAWPYPQLPVQFFDATALPANPAAGCLDSHLRLLGQLSEPALVLEDDAVLAPGFTLELSPPADWRVLWLGRQKLAPEGEVIDAVWARPWLIARTHGYAVREPAELRERLLRAHPRTIDAALSRLPVPQYMLRTATVGQGAGRSDITGGDRPADEFWN